MSGAELSSLFSEINSCIDDCVSIYKASGEASCLPPSFGELGTHLLLIQDSLASAGKGLEAHSLSGPSNVALKYVLEKCSERATSLHDIFQAMIPPAEASRAMKDIVAMKTLSKAAQVGELIDGIMGDLRILTANETFKAAAKSQTEEQAKDIKKNDQEAQTNRGAGAESLHNKVNVSGSGAQYIYNGVGNQNVAMERATQVNGTFQGGTFNFTQA
ncbi:hypothetical protein GGI43DRAFT_196964 [Trichoderma evansii]